jgi:transmembrane sensor
MPKSDQDRLLDEAIDLVIRLQNDPENPVAHEMIAGWRSRSDLHDRIWSKVSGAHGMSGKVLSDRAAAESRSKSKITRRKLLIAGAAGVGAVTTGSVLIPGAVLSARADYMTDKGEIRQIELEDGSVATLGPESALALDFVPARRGIELLQGMCFFDVAVDARRPVVVAAGRLSAQARATSFDMSLDAGFVDVSVAGGAVETQSLYGGAWAQSRLGPGEWMRFDPARRSAVRGRRETNQIAAWRTALLVAESTPVAALVARISRWCPGRVVVADPFIGERLVSGLFDLRAPYRALEAVVHPAGGRVYRISSYLTVIAPF